VKERTEKDSKSDESDKSISISDDDYKGSFHTKSSQRKPQILKKAHQKRQDLA